MDATFWGLAVYAVLSLTSMAMMSIGAAVVISCVVFDPTRGGPRGFRDELHGIFSQPLVRAYAIASGGIILACATSLISARWFPVNFGFDPVQVSWLKDLGKMWYFAFPLILLVAWRRLELSQQGGVLRAWIATFGVLSAMGVLQFFTGVPRASPNWLLPGYYLPVLFFGHHLSVASIWIFPFFASLELAANRELRERTGIKLGWLLPALACGAFTLIFCYSRTLWVGLPVGLLAWGLLRLPRKHAVAFIVGLLLAGGALSQTSVIQRRITTNMRIGERIELWKANLAFFELRPVFGVGFGKNQPLSYDYFRSIHPGQTDFFIGHAHNVYLEVLAGTGIFGALAWLFWVGLQFRGLALGIRRRPPLGFAGAMHGAWIVFLINGATQVNFWEGKVLHAVMWMAGLVLLWATTADKPSTCPSP
jgi:O-antigen ligase